MDANNEPVPHCVPLTAAREKPARSVKCSNLPVCHHLRHGRQYSPGWRLGQPPAAAPGLPEPSVRSGEPHHEGDPTQGAGKYRGAGVAQWLERRNRDRKVPGSSPCRSRGITLFFPGSTFCANLFLYPFHPRVTTVRCKRSRSFCQKCRWQVTAKHTCTLPVWL